VAKPESDRQDGDDSVASAYRKAGPYIDASWQLVGAIGLGSLLGWWLDGRFHTSPWLLVAGSLFGIGAGFYLFFKILMTLGKEKRQ
jgi:F0F1-type ATP synthase assembly protein I